MFQFLAPLAIAAAGHFLGGGGPKKTQTTTPNLISPLDWWSGQQSQDPHYGLLSTPDSFDLIRQNGGPEGLDLSGGHGLRIHAADPNFQGPDTSALDGLRDKFLSLLEGQIEDFNSSGGMPNFNIHAPHVSASHMSPSHAQASLIDMLDQAFQAEPNANLREDVYSRLRSGSLAGAEDNIRKIKDSARASGAGVNAPWVQQLSAESMQRANKESTQGLTDFFDSYVTAALGRRASALAQNSVTQTGVNTFNASANNQASAFNASADNAASATNAQLGLTGQYYSGMLNNQAEGLHQGQLGDIMRMLQFGLSPIQSGSTTQTSQSGGGGPAIAELFQQIFDSIRGGGGGLSQGDMDEMAFDLGE